MPVYGNEQRLMSLVTVEDCAGLLWHYAIHAAYNSFYNIYTFQEVVYKDFLKMIADAYSNNAFSNIPEEQMIKMTGKTLTESVTCEVVLDTLHNDLLDAYKPMHQNLESYIKELAK